MGWLFLPVLTSEERALKTVEKIAVGLQRKAESISSSPLVLLFLKLDLLIYFYLNMLFFIIC